MSTVTADDIKRSRNVRACSLLSHVNEQQMIQKVHIGTTFSLPLFAHLTLQIPITGWHPSNAKYIDTNTGSHTTITYLSACTDPPANSKEILTFVPTQAHADIG